MDELKWLNSAMPLVAALVLGIVGLILAVFAGYFESASRSLRLRLLIPCIIIGFWGFAVDLNQRGKAEQQTDTIVKDAEKILKKTDEIGTGVNTALETLRTLPSKEQFDAESAVLQTQLAVAKKDHDIVEESFVEQKQAALNKRREEADYQRSIANLPIVLAQLKYWKEPFLEVKTDVEARKNDSPYTYHGQELTDKDKEQDDRLVQARADLLESLRKIATSADSLRQLMWNRLSKDRVRDSDGQWEREFANAKTNPSENFNGEAAATYLEDLKKRADASR
ncbi:MAG: hypothetical protein WB421_08235 [Terriglobales bacterium]